MNNIYLIVGKSGSGKTTIVKSLENHYNLKSIQSYTTRPKRYEDETGHIFITDKEYDRLTHVVASTEFDGYRYCATADQIENSDLYIIDPAGIDSIRAFYEGNKNLKVIYISSDVTTRHERMIFRSQHSGKKYLDAVDESLNRIVKDAEIFYKYEHNEVPIDLIVNNGWNGELNKIVDQIYKFIVECEGKYQK